MVYDRLHKYYSPFCSFHIGKFLLLKYLIFHCSIWVFTYQLKKQASGNYLLLALGRGVALKYREKNSSSEKKNEGHKMWNNYRCRIIWQIDIYKNNSVIPGEVGCLEMHYRNSIEKSMQDNLKIEFANLNHSKNLWY